MASLRHSFSRQPTNDADHRHGSLEHERFTPSPLGREEQIPAGHYGDHAYTGQHDDDLHISGDGAGKDYQPIATTTLAVDHDGSLWRKSPGPLTRVFTGWWKEMTWSLISVACIPALIGMLSRYEDLPLPEWPHGITLNTAVAFISTLCRTAFLYPVVEALSQIKWNWYRKPQSLQDFRVFDEASRGPWGSLKLLFTTKGRGISILAALVLVSSIATSTLTQSVVTYPTRMVPLPGNGTATSVRTVEYFWATPNSNAINVTDRLDTGGPIVNTVTGDNGEASNITLPNGALLQPSYGYRNMNLSAGTSVSFNDTDAMKVPLLDYTIIFWPPEQARAYEVLLHFCVNTYSAKVAANIPTVEQVASYVQPHEGEALIHSYNQTYNVTYLTTPDDPDTKYIVDGYGPRDVGSRLAATITGAYTYFGDYNMSAGVGVFGTALERAIVGINSSDSQAIDDAQYAGIFNVSSNLAVGLTNALIEGGSEPAVNGTAWTQQTYVHIRWEWVTLLVVQVALSLLVLIIAILHTAMIEAPIIKGNPLPGLFAIGAQQKHVIEQEQMEIKSSGTLDHPIDHIVDGDLKRVGNKWVLESSADRHRRRNREELTYTGDNGNWAS